jgi:hypothetical protein
MEVSYKGGTPKPPEIIKLGPFDLVLESHGDLRIQHFKNPPLYGENMYNSGMIVGMIMIITYGNNSGIYVYVTFEGMMIRNDNKPSP